MADENMGFETRELTEEQKKQRERAEMPADDRIGIFPAENRSCKTHGTHDGNYNIHR